MHACCLSVCAGNICHHRHQHYSPLSAQCFQSGLKRKDGKPINTYNLPFRQLFTFKAICKCQQTMTQPTDNFMTTNNTTSIIWSHIDQLHPYEKILGELIRNWSGISGENFSGINSVKNYGIIDLIPITFCITGNYLGICFGIKSIIP